MLYCNDPDEGNCSCEYYGNQLCKYFLPFARDDYHHKHSYRYRCQHSCSNSNIGRIFLKIQSDDIEPPVHPGSAANSFGTADNGPDSILDRTGM